MNIYHSLASPFFRHGLGSCHGQTAESAENAVLGFECRRRAWAGKPAFLVPSVAELEVTKSNNGWWPACAHVCLCTCVLSFNALPEQTSWREATKTPQMLMPDAHSGGVPR
jgi:hypothetical protein